MTASPEFCAHLVDLLRSFGTVAVKRMFGGVGVFRDGLMFGLVADDVLYLKADAHNRDAFEDLGLPRFSHMRQAKTMTMSYYQTPAEAMEDPDTLAAWATGAYQAALRAADAKAGRTKKQRKPA